MTDSTRTRSRSNPRPTRRLRVALLFVCALGGTARADPLEDAKRLAKQGATQYQIGHFAEAREAYEKSYEAVPSPGLLFNLGQCAMMLEDYDRAIFLFEGYLREKSDAPNRALVEDLIAEAKQKLEARRAQKEREARGGWARFPGASSPTASPQERAAERRKKIMRTATIGNAVVGTVLLATGLYLSLRSSVLSSAANEWSFHQGTSSARYDELVGDAGQARNAAIGCLAVGGAAAVAAGVLAVFAWR